MKSAKYGLKYCGGCHPSYDRQALAAELERGLGQPLPYATSNEAYDVIFVINGCSARCADTSALSAKKFIVFDPTTIPIDWEGLEL